jgi:hypothetical protein
VVQEPAANPGQQRDNGENDFLLIVPLLDLPDKLELRIDISRPTALGRVAGNIFKITHLATARTFFRWISRLNRSATAAAFPEGGSTFRYISAMG